MSDQHLSSLVMLYLDQAPFELVLHINGWLGKLEIVRTLLNCVHQKSLTSNFSTLVMIYVKINIKQRSRIRWCQCIKVCWHLHWKKEPPSATPWYGARHCMHRICFNDEKVENSAISMHGKESHNSDSFISIVKKWYPLRTLVDRHLRYCALSWKRRDRG